MDISKGKCKAGHILPLTLRWFHRSIVNPPSSHSLPAQPLWQRFQADADRPCSILLNGYQENKRRKLNHLDVCSKNSSGKRGTLTHSSFDARPNQPSKNTTAVTYVYSQRLALHCETSLDLGELLVSLEYIFFLLSSVSLHRSRV